MSRPAGTGLCPASGSTACAAPPGCHRCPRRGRDRTLTSSATTHEAHLTTIRLEAFSDAVIAIIITIMVLELKVPHDADSWSALRPLVPVFLAYILSFIFLGIYWNNHHHLFHVTDEVDGRIMWANLHLLFWLSLVPFVTGWMGENGFTSTPVAAYGIVLLMSAVSFSMLASSIISRHGPRSRLAHAFGTDVKGKVSMLLYLVGIVLASWWPWLSGVCYAAVAMMWLLPDRRIEKEVGLEAKPDGP